MITGFRADDTKWLGRAASQTTRPALRGAGLVRWPLLGDSQRAGWFVAYQAMKARLEFSESGKSSAVRTFPPAWVIVITMPA